MDGQKDNLKINLLSTATSGMETRSIDFKMREPEVQKCELSRFSD